MAILNDLLVPINDKQNQKIFKSIDLFAGIGGIPMGFGRAFKKTLETSFVCEWDKFAQQTDIQEEKPVPAKYYLSDVYVNTLRRHKARHEAKGNGFGYEIRQWDNIAGAIVCGGMGRERNLVIDFRQKNLNPTTHIKGSINKEGIRKMTPREWARLQGFPIVLN